MPLLIYNPKGHHQPPTATDELQLLRCLTCGSGLSFTRPSFLCIMLGCFIYELFSGTELSTQKELHKTDSIPELGRKAEVEKIEEKLERLRQQRRGSETNPICRWIPPPFGFLKMNVDASIFRNIRGGGAVIRDSTGLFICGLSFPISIDAEEIIAVELAAVRFAVQKAEEWGFRNLIIESDSLNLVQELDKENKERDQERDRKRDSLGITVSTEVISMVSHCGKASNNLAQNLTQMGGLIVVTENKKFDYWTTVCPAALYQYWALDLPPGSVRGLES